MSKSYITSNTGASQTLSNIQDEKIPIYDTIADAQSDLANLDENQIVATKDGIPQNVKDYLPLGVILPFGGSTPPSNYLLCDGSAISRISYSDLFNVIGTAYGAGDGSTTFNVPDFRECVPVGAGTNSTDTIADHDAYTLGQFKDDQLQDHTHAYKIVQGQGSNKNHIPAGDTNGQWYGDPTIYSGSARYGSVTRGKQKGVNYIIKARQ